MCDESKKEEFEKMIIDILTRDSSEFPPSVQKEEVANFVIIAEFISDGGIFYGNGGEYSHS